MLFRVAAEEGAQEGGFARSRCAQFSFDDDRLA